MLKRIYELRIVKFTLEIYRFTNFTLRLHPHKVGLVCQPLCYARAMHVCAIAVPHHVPCRGESHARQVRLAIGEMQVARAERAGGGIGITTVLSHQQLNHS